MSNTTTIGKDFSLLELLKFVSLPVFTRLVVSFLSTLDDGLFISRYLGQYALAALSICLPLFMMVDALNMLMGSISTVCSIKMGEGKNDEANSDFSTMIIFVFSIGILLLIIFSVVLRPLLSFLGATELLFPYAVEFFHIYVIYLPIVLVNFIFNSFYIIAGKPKFAMFSQVINICFQIFFDWLFIVRLNIGMKGAAYSNLLGNIAVFIFALFFYLNKNNEIHLVKPKSNITDLLKSVLKYGRVQFFTSIAISISSYITNRVNLVLGQEELVAAYTIVSNVVWMFTSCYFGLLGSVSPIISYSYGEKNNSKFKKVCLQSITLIYSLVIFVILLIISSKKIILFLYLTELSSDNVKNMVSYGLNIYPLSLLFFGFNVLVQEVANIIGEHKNSFILSLFENVIFQNASVIIIPLLFGAKGVWYVFVVCEILTFMLTLYFVYNNQEKLDF